VLRDCARRAPGTANLLSGGVDSSYLQAHWNAAAGPGRSFAVRVDHPKTEPEAGYALTAARAFRTDHTFVPVTGPFADYLVDTVAALGEPPHHVQTCYFGTLAAALRRHGVDAGLCGQGADALFGLGSAAALDTARLIRSLTPIPALRRLASALGRVPGLGGLREYCRLADVLDDPSNLAHPLNQVGAWTDWDAVTQCFGNDGVARATAERRDLLAAHGVRGDVLEQVHACDFLTDSTDTAALWTGLFHKAGVDLVCPWLDSRLVRVAWGMPPAVRFPFRRPKGLLKRALERHLPAALVHRPKLSFGQPVFEWLAPGGQLRTLAEQAGGHDFLPPRAFRTALARPGWFLYSLVCYDVWHKLFVERTIPRPRPATEYRPGEPLAVPSCR
jgi:asparagine synthase (glutamine-hydrolysing)